MQVFVQPSYAFYRKLGEKTIALALPERACVADALALLPMDASEIGVVAVQGQAVSKQAPLQEGVVLSIYPSIIGG